MAAWISSERNWTLVFAWLAGVALTALTGPFAASLFGRKETELSRVGALSGSEGLVSVLNREMEQRGSEQRFSNTSRVVKQIYDRIQSEYDGELTDGHYTGYRRDFYSSEEIVGMAQEFGAVE